MRCRCDKPITVPHTFLSSRLGAGQTRHCPRLVSGATPNFRHGLVEGLWRQPGRRPPAPTRLECGEGLLELPYSGDANALMSIR